MSIISGTDILPPPSFADPYFDKADAIMDDEEMSIGDSVGETPDPTAFDKQRASLQTYLTALPYECESVEEMQSRLEQIVEKIYVCAKSKNWLVLSTWDGMLQWYASSRV